MYYNRKGEEIDMQEWVRLSTPEYKRVAFTRLDLDFSKHQFAGLMPDVIADAAEVETKLAGGEVEISTVWLGLDHGFGAPTRARTPIIFETMIFGGPLDQQQERYETEEQALLGHELIVEQAKRAMRAMR